MSSDHEPVTIRSPADLRAVLSLGSSLMITTRRQAPAFGVEPMELAGRVSFPEHEHWAPRRMHNG